ncbi:FAD-dependent monooxygenase fsr3 [Colletotrichum orbiculare MAFF 240422]|uniref:FAD-dependent monooxygenase fsr3 n=1 Tax=Colletotrichum orbiculare (strain 104-T / ATCC 96160 / CBS 514.97 / LARS 414 / MAFF 240422) TaxID=1213857 RepID=A0A484FLI7_COLOR|nr:FAD-dependent monooxygenase fsr3 [Colletotrichum orbiculare MAFF 240422]
MRHETTTFRREAFSFLKSSSLDTSFWTAHLSSPMLPSLAHRSVDRQLVPFNGAEPIKREALSGLSVLVVGGGIAGLGFAIEAYRKGHDVRIIDRRPDFDDYGDIIGIRDSVVHAMKRWPGFLEACRQTPFPRSYDGYKFDGTRIGKLGEGLGMSRSEFHGLLHRYAQNVGIPVRHSAKAVDYTETDEHAVVELESGERLTADVAVAADGIGSRSWRLVAGANEQPISSGFALFRSTFPVEVALRNPALNEVFANAVPDSRLYFGPGSHMVLGITEKDFIWMLTHKDDGTAEEDWAKPADPKAALPEKWVSPGARVVQIGDSAHTFLPTSASGATMALEDAISLAALLHRSGKRDAPLALRIQNKLRFERVTCAQKMGFKNRENFHNTDWDAAAKNPAAILRQVDNWVSRHNPEQYAYDSYDECASHILRGTPFQNTNSPPGHTFKPWTVAELLAYADRGERIVDDGDWS